MEAYEDWRKLLVDTLKSGRRAAISVAIKETANNLHEELRGMGYKVYMGRAFFCFVRSRFARLEA